MRECWLVVVCVATAVAAVFFHITSAHRVDLALPQERFIDAWTIQHSVSGFLAAFGLYSGPDWWRGKDKTSWQERRKACWILLALAFTWESFECAIENGHLGSHMESWIGREVWINRFSSDLVAVVGGGWVYMWLHARMQVPAWRVVRLAFLGLSLSFTIVWLSLNWFAPTVMHIEEQLLLGL